MSLRRNTLWNLAGAGLPLLLGAVTIPYLIRMTGVEAFGVLTLVWALIGYFSLFDFGLGRALTQQVAAARSAGFHAQLPSLVKTGLWFTAGMGVLGGLILAALANQLALHWLKVSVPLQSSTHQALLIAAIGIPLTTVTTGLRGVLEAYEDFKVVNLLRMGLGAANFGLPALSVMFVGNSLAWMVAGLIAARAIVLLAHLWLVHQKLPAGWASARFNNENMRSLLSFGIWMTVSNIIGPLMVTADRFIISAVLGASVVAYYTVPFEVLLRVLVLPGALTAALFPRLAAIINTDNDEAKRLYKNCLKIITAVLVPTCVVIALGSKWGMTLWLGHDFAEHSWRIVVVMALGLMLNGIAYVPFATIQAKGDARTTARLHIFELLFYIPLLFFCLKHAGLIGAAVAWTTRAFFDWVALLLLVKRVIPEKI
ncbi:flippase [Polynucleobacter sp. 39-46-10]|jgi:O-antigen/teichoic acid export membrane protein|uniref:flippase n=1 Tax=Polynucleobacter sp. 39-46-10 TaxID=1970428 RepID=UPI000BC7AA20|nr:flippase [Polynucleobacter sp. 39-46-10]OYY22138.1 MAG: polysaccharide biosynthesis protein [Sphingobacteriia bacterium 35-40-8]OZA75886.1 MAG: polysaccharide biosynthesis protein [Polynucleobacter sp. 39-46-10]